MDSSSEFPKETAALIKATAVFFEEVEAQKASQKQTPLVGVPVSVTRSTGTLSDQPDGAALTRMGPVDALTGYRITWYPVDALHGTIDFMGLWGEANNLVCGYLTWDLAEPEEPELTAVSAHFVDAAVLGRASDTQMQQSLLEANCAFGTLEDNFRFFGFAG